MKGETYMAKKLGKLVLFSALAGAAAAGTYYYLQNKKNDSSDDFDDIDDFDDFDEDLDDDIDLTAKTANVTESKNRSYIDLENVKGKIGEKVIETIDKTKETLDKAKEFIEEQTTPPTETVYTQVDLPGSGSQISDENTTSETTATTANTSTTVEPAFGENKNADTPTAHTTQTVMTSVSATYATDESKKSNSENFFDDSDEE